MDHSPVPNKKETEKPVVLEKYAEIKQMTFPEAMEKVIEGKLVSRLEWDDPGHYGVLKNTLLCLHKAGEDENTVYTWIINDGDLFAKDWVIVELNTN